MHDHFRPPLSARSRWYRFHAAWATSISSALNQRLPAGYFAETNVQFSIEIDVATFEEASQTGADIPSGSADSGLDWTPPAPVLTLPFPLVTDTVEVTIFRSDEGPTLVGAIELVSPANKDRPAHRDAFVSKCVTYLQQAVGLVLVDVVPSRGANLHDELLARVGGPDASPLKAELYAAAYRPVERADQPSLDIWQETLAIGRPLPTMPLWLRGGLCLPVELEATYERTCREERVPVNGV